MAFDLHIASGISFTSKLQITLVYKLPGPSMTVSAPSIAFIVSGSGSAKDGSMKTLSIFPLPFAILLSPFIIILFYNRAYNVAFSIEEGRSLSLIANISLDFLTASEKSPLTSDMAVINRFPKLCPCKLPSLNLY